jgi:hypothetical protein
MATPTIASLLYGRIVSAGVPIVGVSIGAPDDKTTWVVQPADLQGDAQPTIDAFDSASAVSSNQFYALRVARDALLYGCDWTALSSAPLSAAEVEEWATYRQALRDLPAQTTDILNPPWPTAPWVLNPKPV